MWNTFSFYFSKERLQVDSVAISIRTNCKGIMGTWIKILCQNFMTLSIFVRNWYEFRFSWEISKNLNSILIHFDHSEIKSNMMKHSVEVQTTCMRTYVYTRTISFSCNLWGRCNIKFSLRNELSSTVANVRFQVDYLMNGMSVNCKYIKKTWIKCL